MKETERIADQLRRSLQGPAWHGPALMELLRDVTAQEAAVRPANGAHSIWELVEHVAAWLRFVERNLQGDEYKVSDAENFPAPAVVSEAAWEETRDRLVTSTESLQQKVVHLDEARLDKMVDTMEGTQTSVYALLHGVIQHNLYHAGQIAVLKRMTRGRTGASQQAAKQAGTA